MYGGPSKHGYGDDRGGSGGASRSRNSFPPPQRNPAAAERLSVGGGSTVPRKRTTTNSKASSSTAVLGAVEETHSLVPGTSRPAFAMIIRLAPNMVEEIRRLEAQGGTPKIKFDGNSKITGGNIINVGDKEFEFTWSREIADCCDIYEERESGEDGNGLLVERGCAWRKLSVRRTLDESTTKLVKMPSVEAERKTNSRKAIVIDPGNPSLLTKQVALAEANTGKMFNKEKKGPPLKKQRVDGPQVGFGGPKPAHKPELAPADTPKYRLSASPASSPPDPFITSVSPFRTGNRAKSHTGCEDDSSTLRKCKQNTIKVEIPTSNQANRKEQAETSSETGGDSDSKTDSSNSGSQSRSRVGGESGSCSDSEASSISKEGSDVEVDIMSDDDREMKHELQHQTDRVMATCSDAVVDQDVGGSDNIDIEGNGSDAIDIEDDDSDAVDIEGYSTDGSRGYDAIEKATVHTSSTPGEDGREQGIEHLPSDNDKQRFIGTLFDDTENIAKDSFNHEQSDSSEKFRQKSEPTKRLKPKSSTQQPIMGKDLHSGCMNDLLPGKLDEESCRGSSSQILNSFNMDGKADSDFQPSGPRISQSAKGTVSNGLERFNKPTDTPVHVHKSDRKHFQDYEVLPCQTGKSSADNRKCGSFVKEKKPRRSQKNGGSDGERPLPSDARNRKQCEMGGIVEDEDTASGLNLGSSPMHSSRTSMDKLPPGIVLQREISLELGEFREALVDEPPGKQLKNQRSFRDSHNSKPSHSESHALDSDKRKLSRKSKIDTSTPCSDTSNNITLAQKVEDLERSHFGGSQRSGQHNLRADHAEVESQNIKVVDLSNKSMKKDIKARQEGSVEAYGESHNKAPISALQHGSKQRPASSTSKDNYTHASNPILSIVDGQKVSGGRKKRQPSFDVDDSSYAKYEKENPELKDPITDFSQYKVYVQEYQDKYDIYSSLNKILQSYRNKFQKLGEKLELAKSRDLDRYDIVLKKLKNSYCGCGEKYKRLKKTFIVLHEELKHLKKRIKDYAVPHRKDS